MKIILFSILLCVIAPSSADYNGIDFYSAATEEVTPVINSIINDAEKGNAKAQFYLSVLSSRGVVVEKSPEKSALWLKKSADNGDPEANYYLGYKYLHGTGIDKNIYAAIQRFRASALAGNIKSSQILGVITYGMYGASFVNLEESISYLQKSSRDGNGFASFLLSCIYKYDFPNQALFNKYIDLSHMQKDRRAIMYTTDRSDQYHERQCVTRRQN